MSFEFHWPTQTTFGPGAAKEIGRHLKPPGGRSSLLVVTHQEAWARALAEQLKSDLEAAGWESAHIFAQVEPNPTWETVSKGVEFSEPEGAEAILAVGGGSVMDASKVIAARSDAGRLVTMPTTAGTGGEISPWAVISNLASREKESVIAHWPDQAVLDPELTLSLPPKVTFFTAIDAFVHALEAYLSSAASPVTDMFALEAMRMIAAHMRSAVANGGDLAARSALLQGSLYAGGAMLHAGLGLMHAIGNVAGGLYHEQAHGALLLKCLRPVLRFNRSALPERKASHIDPLVRRVEHDASELLAEMHIPDVIMSESDLPLLVARALKNVNAATNPRPASADQLRHIVLDSFQVQPSTGRISTLEQAGENHVTP